MCVNVAGNNSLRSRKNSTTHQRNIFAEIVFEMCGTSVTSLKAYLADINLHREKGVAQALDAELQKLKDSESEKIRRVVLETERVRLEAEKAMADAKLKSKTERLEREQKSLEVKLAAEKAEADEKAKVEAEDRALKTEMSKVKKLLYIFMAKTNKQFRSDGYMELTAEPTAISLTALSAYGALKPGNEGNYKLKQAMTAMADKDDRPQPPIDVFAFDHSNAIPVQNLLIKHGDAMVRAGLLVS